MTNTSFYDSILNLAPTQFENYWAIVLGPDRSAADVVREFDLAGSTRRDLDEWLGTAESEAWSIGHLEGEVVPAHHQRALDALEDAATIYVVWGDGAATADVSGDATLQPFTPWEHDLVGEQWVASFMGSTADLDADPAVIGYRALKENERREWREADGRLQQFYMRTNRLVPNPFAPLTALLAAAIEQGSAERERRERAPNSTASADPACHGAAAQASCSRE